MTGSRDAAEKLTDSIHGIPAERTTQLNADTALATADAEAFKKRIEMLPDGQVTVKADTRPANDAITPAGQSGQQCQ